MPEPISLISSANIHPEEFSSFLQHSGALLHPDAVYDGRISRENNHIWIVLDNSELKNFDADEIELIAQKLADKPKTHILLDISTTPNSQQLAIEFACQFAKKWSCIIYESSQKIYSVQELMELCQTGQGFVGSIK
ncbi:MAG: hypothetical protein Fur006_11180 [Coleofasciculaceae cyanobacterium]